MARVSRREFVVAATALATLGGGQTAAAQTQPSEGKVAPADAAEVESRIEWIFRKYGARLNDEQRADIRRIITTGQASIDAMRAFPLDNSTAPATRFHLLRGVAFPNH